MISRSASRRIRRERIGGISAVRQRQERFRLAKRICLADEARKAGTPMRTQTGQFVPTRRWRDRLNKLSVMLGFGQQPQRATA